MLCSVCSLGLVYRAGSPADTSCRTELGHGSNVRGLETQAIWDPRKKEFILHSPTLTASKWWNGECVRRSEAWFNAD